MKAAYGPFMAQKTYCANPRSLQLSYAAAQRCCWVVHFPPTALSCAVSGLQLSLSTGRNESRPHTAMRCRHQLEQCRLLQGLQSRRPRLAGL